MQLTKHKHIEEKPQREKLYTIEEMAALLNVDKRKLVEWVQHRRIPYVKVNNELIRFRVSEIVEWVKKKQNAKKKQTFEIR